MDTRFEKVMQAVIKRLDQILQEDGEEERGFAITSKDFMNDFATDEFVSKNIRVYPTSNQANQLGGLGDDEAKTQDGQANAGVSRQGELAEDDQSHSLPFELRQERDAIKKRFEDYTAQKRAEEERARRRRL